MGFMGTYDARLDDKNRVAIPAKFRHEFGEGQAFLIAMKEGCISIYTEQSFENTREEVKQNPRTTVEGRQAWRQLFARTEPVKPDVQGRVVVPQRLLSSQGIAQGEVVFVGMDEWVEMWSPEGYAREVEREEE